MGKAIRNVFKVDTLCLTECTDGYYLHDTTVGINIAVHSKSEQEACIEAIRYYQKRFGDLKHDYNVLYDKVENFLSQFNNED